MGRPLAFLFKEKLNNVFECFLLLLCRDWWRAELRRER